MGIESASGPPAPNSENLQRRTQTGLIFHGLGCLAVVVALGWGCGELLDLLFGSLDMRAAYDSRAQVVADQAIERGWIPVLIPGSARDIREAHNLDINRLVGRFEFDLADLAATRERSELYPEGADTRPGHPLSEIGVTNELDERWPHLEFRRTGYFILAIDPSRETCWFWN
jgi:hypothetical protein